jgi:hypothetical protein
VPFLSRAKRRRFVLQYPLRRFPLASAFSGMRDMSPLWVAVSNDIRSELQLLLCNFGMAFDSVSRCARLLTVKQLAARGLGEQLLIIEGSRYPTCRG